MLYPGSLQAAGQHTRLSNPATGVGSSTLDVNWRHAKWLKRHQTYKDDRHCRTEGAVATR